MLFLFIADFHIMVLLLFTLRRLYERFFPDFFQMIFGSGIVIIHERAFVLQPQQIVIIQLMSTTTD